MSTPNRPEHCRIDKLACPDEMERVRNLFKQQNIHIPESALIGHISERHGPQDCPFHTSLGKDTQYCVDQCFLQNVLNENTEEASK